MRNEADESLKWTKRMLKINCVAGIVVGLLLFTQDALAVAPAMGGGTDWDNTWLDVNVASKHFGLEGMHTKVGYREFNEQNFGLGLSFESTHHSIGFGFYDNSFGDTSVYIGMGFYTNKNKPLRFGVDLAGVSGYEKYGFPPVVVMPNVVATAGKFRVKAGLIPVLNGVATLQFGYNF